MENIIQKSKNRDSSIELFRIITMLIIVAHHYVVNSGLSQMLVANADMSMKSIFYWIFGWGGKTGINCFVFITGYFMCKSNISWKKFLKLFFEVEFYRILFFLVFTISGYQEFSITVFAKSIVPIFGIGTSFTPSFLVFFLFIPFLNILINGMSEKLHLMLIGLCVFVYSLLPTLNLNTSMNYVLWFMVLYFIASYVRIYNKKIFDSKNLWGILALISLIVSWSSVVVGVFVLDKFNINAAYYFVADSNKIMALGTAFCLFMYFKNLNLGYNKVINKIAASAFGVFLIHANSDAMRNWLWKDVLDNTGYYNSQFYILHAVVSVIVIYIVCTLIDMLRIKFIETPLFKSLEKIKIK